MPDLVVDTAAQRLAALDLRAAAAVAGEAADRGSRLGAYVPGLGTHRAARAASGFLHSWTYGMGIVQEDTLALAGMLDAAAATFEAIETQLSVAAGGSAVSAPPALVPPPVLPAVRTRGWAALPTFGVPVTLANATHWQQLIPGHPEDADALAGQCRNFAVAIHNACTGLSRLCTDGWQGRAAEMFRAHLGQTPHRLEVAGNCFGAASGALRRYAEVLDGAQAQAHLAWRLWGEAAPYAAASGSGIGVVGPALTLPSGMDPQADMARAASLLQSAREDLDAEARALEARLDEAADAAPDKPGLLAGIVRGIASFATGFGEGSAGLVTGAVGIASLAARLVPTNAIADPGGYLDTLEGILDVAAHVVTDPFASAQALIDWETWKNDPARAAGALAPELILALATAGVVGAHKASTATRRLDEAAEKIRDRDGNVYPHLDRAEAEAQVKALGYGLHSASGQAVLRQLALPYGRVDVWEDITLQPGDLIAVGVPGKSGFAVPITADDLARIAQVGARDWFESVQVPPKRVLGEDGTVPQPTMRQEIEIYSVQDVQPAARAITEANTQFGAGGRAEVFLEVDAFKDPDRLHRAEAIIFDPRTLPGRIEDPAFKYVDPTLPDKPLDPRHQRNVGRAQGGAVGAAAGVTDTEPPGGNP